LELPDRVPISAWGGCWVAGIWVGLLEFWVAGILEFFWVAGIFGLLEFFLFGCCEKLIWMGVGYFWWEVVIKK
jgi:hypothetical protein